MPSFTGEKTVDNSYLVLLFRGMAQPVTKLTSPTSLLVDAILVLGFFAFIYTLVAPHVPSNDKSMIVLWGGLCAACMSGVFWLCIQMFRVVLRAQQADRRK
jgi:hypothetical protein